MAASSKGLALALRLRKVIPQDKIDDTVLVSECSGLCRDAASMKRIAERQCSEEMSERTAKFLEAKDDYLERRAIRRVKFLSQKSGLPMFAIFSGDPRGAMVKIQIPGCGHIYDCFANEGVLVP